MDFVVVAAHVVAEARLLAIVSVPADATDAADPRDCLSPLAWSLRLGSEAPVGSLLPRLCHVESAQNGTNAPTALFLELDAPLAPGVSYKLALMPNARAAYGQPTSDVAVLVQGRSVKGIDGQRPGVLAGDVALPVRADSSGDVALLDQLSALRARVLLLVAVRKGAFSHAARFGRGVEPKRSYSPARLSQEASQLRTELLADPAVRDASVRVSNVGHVVAFDIVVNPHFQTEPLRMLEKIEAGENH